MTHRERFDANVCKDVSGCWPWTGPIGTKGYGKFGVDYRTVLAHRFSYETYVGPIPKGLTLDHLCRVRHCVNPDHLEAVTTRENILRGTGFAAINAAKTHCPQGHPYDGDNLFFDRGARCCRTCNRDRCRQYQSRRRQQVAA